MCKYASGVVALLSNVQLSKRLRESCVAVLAGGSNNSNNADEEARTRPRCHTSKQQQKPLQPPQTKRAAARQHAARSKKAAKQGVQSAFTDRDAAIADEQEATLGPTSELNQPPPLVDDLTSSHTHSDKGSCQPPSSHPSRWPHADSHAHPKPGSCRTLGYKPDRARKDALPKTELGRGVVRSTGEEIKRPAKTTGSGRAREGCDGSLDGWRTRARCLNRWSKSGRCGLYYQDREDSEALGLSVSLFRGSFS
eukprot:2559674-Rhodomonas_salina.4